MIVTPISSGKLVHPGTSTKWLNRFLGLPKEKIIGCSLLELARIEEVMCNPLPLAYKQWMFEAGRNLGSEALTSEFRRAFMTYPEVLDLRAGILELLDEVGGDRTLLDRTVPFYCWEFDEIHLLDAAHPHQHPLYSNIDCPVLSLDQQSGQTSWCSPSFSEFIGWKIFLRADNLLVNDD